MHRAYRKLTGGLDPLMLKYNASIQYDKLLFKEDILGSIAFAGGGGKTGGSFGAKSDSISLKR